MDNVERKTLAVIGAGPKGLAVAIKAKVLTEMGFPVQQVILIEKHSVAAHWAGDAGYTNGEMKLGTSPEKDVVFPLETEVGDPELTQRVRQRLLEFSWASYLVHTGGYSEWVDRGRPAPNHALWAKYLRWVGAQLLPEVQILKAEVKTIDVDFRTKRWNLELLRSSGTSEVLSVDGVMLTGPGATRREFSLEADTADGVKVYDLESFWCALRTGGFELAGKTAVVGAGENAASILLELSKNPSESSVDVIAPKGFISTRAENFYENQFYSQPEKNGWTDLELKDRIDFIQRTDLGVFSGHAMQILNDQQRHQIRPGRLIGLSSFEGQVEVRTEYQGVLRRELYDQVILATGFDQAATVKKLFSVRAVQHLEVALQDRVSSQSLSAKIQRDLSVQGLIPSLHLPMLAGLMQGPGFANLSSLGRLSDRVLLPTALADTGQDVLKHSVAL